MRSGRSVPPPHRADIGQGGAHDSHSSARPTMFWIKSLFFCGLVNLGGSLTHQIVCEFYEKNVNQTEEVCEKTELDKRMHCYASWRNGSDGVEIEKKGCWLDHESCYDKYDCVATDVSSQVYFCCCEGVMCNQNFSYRALPATPSTTPVVEMKAVQSQKLLVLQTVAYSLVPITGFTVILIALFYMWRRHTRIIYHEQIPTIDPNLVTPPSPQTVRPVQLLELKARGRFGSVWKAHLLNEYVAVKIFPVQDMQSWLTEQEIYNLPNIKHDNILHFIGSEKRGENAEIEFWLITEYHEKGSLCDYLKGNLINWLELCKIVESMARGLSFLHEEIPGINGMATKPAIAHRDFKSKNVLLQVDMSACIADFGLALKFEPRKPPGDTHGQVGTRRYMAPEILDGAITFTKDAFLKIDMYACALVVWELMSRCSAIDGPIDEYQLPFEEEVGLHPTLEDMQEMVVIKKLHPTIRENWLKTSDMKTMVNTIEECWDHDAEARLSAKCVEERVSQIYKNTLLSTSDNSVPSTVVIINNNQDTPSKEANIS